jgi:hypothetical protein
VSAPSSSGPRRIDSAAAWRAASASARRAGSGALDPLQRAQPVIDPGIDLDNRAIFKSAIVGKNPRAGGRWARASGVVRRRDKDNAVLERGQEVTMIIAPAMSATWNSSKHTSRHLRDVRGDR